MTIAEQLNLKEFPFIIKNSNGKQIYYEDSTGYWWKRQYDERNNQIYSEDSEGFWAEREYDSRNNQINYKNSL